MPTRFNISISDNAAEIIKDLKELPAQMAIAIGKAMDKENQFAVSDIQRNYLSFPKSGPPIAIGCRVQTNRLRGSIRATKAVVSPDGSVSSSIGSNVAYAAAQEFGATIPPHKITAKNGKALRFQIGGRVIFAKSVNFPGATLPARGFVQRGITDNLPNYGNAISDAIVAAWNQGKN